MICGISQVGRALISDPASFGVGDLLARAVSGRALIYWSDLVRLLYRDRMITDPGPMAVRLVEFIDSHALFLAAWGVIDPRAVEEVLRECGGERHLERYSYNMATDLRQYGDELRIMRLHPWVVRLQNEGYIEVPDFTRLTSYLLEAVPLKEDAKLLARLINLSGYDGLRSVDKRQFTTQARKLGFVELRERRRQLSYMLQLEMGMWWSDPLQADVAPKPGVLKPLRSSHIEVVPPGQGQVSASSMQTPDQADVHGEQEGDNHPPLTEEVTLIPRQEREQRSSGIVEVDGEGSLGSTVESIPPSVEAVAPPDVQSDNPAGSEQETVSADAQVSENGEGEEISEDAGNTDLLDSQTEDDPAPQEETFQESEEEGVVVDEVTEGGEEQPSEPQASAGTEDDEEKERHKQEANQRPTMNRRVQMAQQNRQRLHVAYDRLLALLVEEYSWPFPRVLTGEFMQAVGVALLGESRPHMFRSTLNRMMERGMVESLDINLGPRGQPWKIAQPEEAEQCQLTDDQLRECITRACSRFSLERFVEDLTPVLPVDLGGAGGSRKSCVRRSSPRSVAPQPRLKAREQEGVKTKESRKRASHAGSPITPTNLDVATIRHRTMIVLAEQAVEAAQDALRKSQEVLVQARLALELLEAHAREQARESGK